MLVVVVGNLLGERDVVGACIWGGWEGRRMKGRLVPLSAEGKWVLSVLRDRKRVEGARRRGQCC